MCIFCPLTNEFQEWKVYKSRLASEYEVWIWEESIEVVVKSYAKRAHCLEESSTKYRSAKSLPIQTFLPKHCPLVMFYYCMWDKSKTKYH